MPEMDILHEFDRREIAVMSALLVVLGLYFARQGAHALSTGMIGPLWPWIRKPIGQEEKPARFWLFFAVYTIHAVLYLSAGIMLALLLAGSLK